MKHPDPNYGIVPLAEVEREEIEHAVQSAPSLDVAAKLLGIGRTTLYRKLADYGRKPAGTNTLRASVRVN